MPEVQTPIHKVSSIKHQPISKRYYFDVALGSVCLTGADTGGAYCLLEVSLAPGIGVRPGVLVGSNTRQRANRNRKRCQQDLAHLTLPSHGSPATLRAAPVNCRICRPVLARSTM